MKHTKGKWKIGQFGDNVTANFGKRLGVREICSLVDGPASNSLREANARLIAAAPDMLEALKKILVVLGEFKISKHDPRAKQEIEAITSAIAKAEGREE